MGDREFVGRLLEQDQSANHELESWIHAAANPYRSRLSWCWEDILQDLRLEVLQLFRKGSFEGKSSLKSYVWSVVNHTCIDHLRKNASYKFTTLDAVAEIGAPQMDPMERMREHDHTRFLIRVFGEIPEQCRRLWRLIFAGYSVRQMSKKLEITEGALRVRVHRCRKQAVALREKLGR